MGGDAGKALLTDVKLEMRDDGAAENPSGQKRAGEKDKEEGAAGKKRRVQRKGHILCGGCQLALPSESFAANQRVCMQCKRILDRISAQAHRQNQAQRFRDAKKSDKSIHALILHYKKLMGKSDGKATKFSVADFKEIHSNSQGTEARSHGVMIWQEQAVEFWMSAAGGCLDREAAEETWAREASPKRTLFAKRTCSALNSVWVSLKNVVMWGLVATMLNLQCLSSTPRLGPLAAVCEELPGSCLGYEKSEPTPPFENPDNSGGSLGLPQRSHTIKTGELLSSLVGFQCVGHGSYESCLCCVLKPCRFFLPIRQEGLANVDLQAILRLHCRAKR